jgi:mono/diheme cytochrome c family protein
MRMQRLPLLPLAAIAVLAACSDAGEGGDGALVKRGKVVYQTNCTACHSRDPSQAGPIGPAVTGSSLELLTAKVLRNEYPPGYTPKRDTKAMVPLVHLKPELPAIAAYLGTTRP